MTEHGVKDKLQNFIYDTGRKFLQDLSKSLSSGREKSVGAQKLAGKTVVVDAGHGGHNPGAVRYGLRESDNNLAVAQKLKRQLEAQGAAVVMTRSADHSMVDASRQLKEELQARVDIAAKSAADLFVSIHTNSNENTAIQGAMTFYYDDAGKSLAQSVQEKMISAADAVDKGISYGNFLVLRNSKIPAILVEMGFITHYEEAQKLSKDAYREKMALGISEGIAAYLTK